MTPQSPPTNEGPSSGGAVAWRWQEYDHPEDPYIFGETGPREHEEHFNLTPLYAHPHPVQDAEGMRERLAKAVRPILDRQPMIDSSQSHKLDIQAGWIANVILAALPAVGGGDE